jgi:hypothetical protein
MNYAATGGHYTGITPPFIPAVQFGTLGLIDYQTARLRLQAWPRS